MKYVKWIFVVLLINSLTSFIEKDTPTSGLSEGDVAPDFTIQTTLGEQPTLKLADMEGHYVLLSFWASYDAPSRTQNALLNNVLRSSQKVKMVSVSFDSYGSIFEEAIRKDQIVTPACFVETRGEDSKIYKEYRLNRGFANYLLDGKGVIVAKNISPAQLSAYLNKIG